MVFLAWKDESSDCRRISRSKTRGAKLVGMPALIKISPTTTPFLPFKIPGPLSCQPGDTLFRSVRDAHDVLSSIDAIMEARSHSRILTPTTSSSLNGHVNVLSGTKKRKRVDDGCDQLYGQSFTIQVGPPRIYGQRPRCFQQTD